MDIQRLQQIAKHFLSGELIYTSGYSSSLNGRVNASKDDWELTPQLPTIFPQHWFESVNQDGTKTVFYKHLDESIPIEGNYVICAYLGISHDEMLQLFVADVPNDWGGVLTSDSTSEDMGAHILQFIEYKKSKYDSGKLINSDRYNYTLNSGENKLSIQ